MTYNLERLFNILALVHTLPFFTTFLLRSFFVFLNSCYSFLQACRSVSIPLPSYSRLGDWSTLLGIEFSTTDRVASQREKKGELSRFSEIMNATSVEKISKISVSQFFLLPSCVLFWLFFCDRAMKRLRNVLFPCLHRNRITSLVNMIGE